MKISIDADPVLLLKITAAKDRSDKTWTRIICDGLGVPYEQPTYGRPSASDIEERYANFLKEYQADVADQVKADMIERTKQMQRRLGRDSIEG